MAKKTLGEEVLKDEFDSTDVSPGKLLQYLNELERLNEEIQELESEASSDHFPLKGDQSINP